ncbi:hypothetical protein O181_004609 [Austropuccinia psidii MF-1]|uniref:Uncharacterized protein n=1 Tax=Austropuccinia psidii MF-1 TaxID=1389203 RepID=A0A9Q3BG46_9BASI|nr:hypothetical protein [Austropuccinia psidii MF-1]
MRPHPLQMRLGHCPPISALTTPYACTPPPHLLLGLQSLRCCGALKLCLQRRPHPPLRLQRAFDAAYHSHACSALPTCLQHPPHTGWILMLLQPPQDETMMPHPISALTTPYASAPVPFLLCHLKFLRSCGPLKICL